MLDTLYENKVDPVIYLLFTVIIVQSFLTTEISQFLERMILFQWELYSFVKEFVFF